MAARALASPRRRRSSATVVMLSSGGADDTHHDGDDSRSLVTTAARKTLPPFLDSDETVHFFNDDLVLRTNAIRIADDGDAAGRTATSARTDNDGSEDRDVDDEYEHLSDEYDDDYEEDDYDDEEYDECEDDDDDEEEDEESKTSRAAAAAAAAARKATKRLRPSAWTAASALSKRNSLRSDSLPDPAPLYDDVFHAFDDLYATADQTQRKRALSAVATFTRRMHSAKSYRYRKRCEFLRVCYQRALETEPALEEASEVTAAAGDTAVADRAASSSDTPVSAAGPSALLKATRSDDVVETCVPSLHPRKWPHLPFRAPLQWLGSVDDAVTFLSKLAELPPASLRYEPVDTRAFVTDVLALLKASGMEEPLDRVCRRQEALPEDATAGLTALLGMGVQLQSFSLLSLTALQFATLGHGTLLGDSAAIRPRLKDQLETYWKRLVTQSAQPRFAATYSRSLVAQWKISACQPSSSDALATDGRFLYVFTRTGLLKIGTGNGNTVRDYVYAHNRTYTRGRDAERSWLCCIGASLFCRTIVMPSNRVDRFNTSDLERVEELYFSPNRSVSTKGVSESSVYAMLTDGEALYTLRCVDTFKRAADSSKLSDRREKSQSSEAARDPLMMRVVEAETATNEPLTRTFEEATIKIGDRVVRGPDWKWGSQDGTEGSIGTVERVTTWGGIPGSGVTVRWDKTQRVNTYRWGAEECYDLVIVLVKDDQVVERMALPSKSSAKSGASDASTSTVPPTPRHQFVLFRHDVARMVSPMELDQADIDVFLDLTALETGNKQSVADAKAKSAEERALVSALHAHSLSLCTAKSSWMCDGGLASCDGNNAAKRFRCDAGCDFDLCESCIRSTVMVQSAKSDDGATATDGTVVGESEASMSSESKETVDDAESSEPSTSDAASGESVPVEAALSAATASPKESSPEMPSLEMPSLEMPSLEMPSLEAPSSSSPASNPFAILRASMFYDEESSVARAPEQAATASADSKAVENALISELYSFWGGLYSRKECLVALRRNNFSLNEASVWIDKCASDLRKQFLVPTTSVVVLEAKTGSGALDPVLLVAGSFYMSSGQLCIVSPPGLYTPAESQSDKTKRAATSCDAAWFYSVTSGKLLVSETEALPVLLKGVPAGSPTCVNPTSGHILVYSGYLNCLEVYVDPSQRAVSSLVEQSCGELSSTTSLGDLGEALFAQLHLLMLQRWSLPAYKHARAGLQDILFHTEREPSVVSTKTTATATGDSSQPSGSHSKSKARRIKNIRGRIKMLDEIGQRDPPGYFIPFCVDFQDDGLLHLFRALVVVCDEPASRTDVYSTSRAVGGMLKDVLCLLAELLSEVDYAGLSIVGECDDPVVNELCRRTEVVLFDLAWGKSSTVHLDDGLEEPLVSRVIASAQTVLTWGMRKGLFYREKKSTMLLEVGDAIASAAELDPSVLPVGQSLLDGTRQQSEPAWVYRLLQALLCCPTDASRVDIADFVPLDFDEFTRLLSTLFKLSALEFKSLLVVQSRRDVSSSVTNVTVVTKALHSLVNYCSVRLYCEKDEPVELKAKLKESGTRVTPVELFNAFALACIRACTDVVASIGGEPLSAACDDSNVRASVIGTILPLVMTTVSNYPASVSIKVRHGIADLLKALDTCASRGDQQSESSDANALDVVSNDAFFDGDQVVETPHPYNQAQSSFRRVVRVAGASLLHIDFDPRSGTSGEADFVFITPGRAWFNSDRMAFAEGGIGDSGGCFFGSYVHGNWPTQGLSIVGDTATIMLCATSQARDNATVSEKQRWGLRCTVRGLFAPSPPRRSWLSDACSGVASACSVVAERLMQSIPVQQVEQQCRKWLDARDLFSPASRRHVTYVREILEGSGQASLVTLLGKFTRLHTSPKTSMSAVWTDALGAVAAVLVAQADIAVVATVAKMLKKTTPSARLVEAMRGDVQGLAPELQRVEQWMLRHVQLLKEWHYLQEEEGVSVDDLKDRYGDNLDQLRELCGLQSVAFHASDVNGSITKLHALLQRYESPPSDSSGRDANSYELVAKEVAEKAQLLLTRYTNEKLAAGGSESASQADSGDTSERPRHRVATAGEFFRCSLPASVLADCAQVHSKRLRDRIAGFHLAMSAVAGVESPELVSWFVGRGLVALAGASLGEPDYWHGCLLGDSSLLTEFDALLHHCHSFNARLAADTSRSLALRCIASADAYCSMRPHADDQLVHSFDQSALLLRHVDTAGRRRSLGRAVASALSQMRNVLWILHRLLQERSVRVLSLHQEHVELGAVSRAIRVLYAYFERVADNGLDAASSQDAVMMMSRLLRAAMKALATFVKTKEEAAWWSERALSLLLRPGIPVSASICGVRTCRQIVRICGDAIFDLKVDVRLGAEGHPQSEELTLGRDLPRLLVERVGELVALLPSAQDLESGNDETQFHTLVLLNEDAVAKLSVAIEKVAEPDISFLRMQLDPPPTTEATPSTAAADEDVAAAAAAIVHASVRCDGCDMSPLRGYRFKCFTCPNYDLCAECYTGEKHDLDHEFIRLADSSSGMGDVLQPRSKGGGTVPEASLVGSKHWKGSIVKAEVAAKGYALYCSGAFVDCLATARGLAEVGCLATVVTARELTEIERVFCWESQLAASVEPGLARTSRRSTPAHKNVMQKGDRATIRSMNAAVAERRSAGNYRRRMPDVLALASEVIATVRSLLEPRDDTRQWRRSTVQALGGALDKASELLELPTLTGRECRQRYFEAIGAANVLGGFNEPPRVGGSVARVGNTKAVEPAGVFVGTVCSYALGNNSVGVLVTDRQDDVTTARIVEMTVADVRPVSEIALSPSVIKSLEHLAPSFCVVVKRIHAWLMTANKTGESEQDCLYRSELACAFMRSFACVAPSWMSLFDNQIISTHGNIAALLFHLAQLCLKEVGLGSVASQRELLWQMEWIRAYQLQCSLATRPIKRTSFYAVDSAECIFRPPSSSTDDDASSGSGADNPASEYVFNLYAYSSRADIPQHSGRNKLLEYWEKNVIPAIESYVAGSFKSYEMDYFFAQLREPLREGNAAAALKIAYTLCDGHVPSGCVYPDRDTDWSALQIDEVEVGGRYLITTEKLDSGGWPREMLWTVGHSGVVRLVNPAGMILLDVMNPVSSESEYWWYHVDSLKPCARSVRSFSEQSVADFDECGERLLKTNKQLICSLARTSVFELLQVAPDHVMTLSIDRKARRQGSQVGNRYSMGELLKLAATADLECPDKIFASGGAADSSLLGTSETAVVRGVRSSSSAGAKSVHIKLLQSILNKHFDRTLGGKAGAHRLSENEVLPLISKKQTKPVKASAVSSNASSVKQASQPTKATQPDAEPPATLGKYRFMLMESLLRELKKNLESSSAFSQTNAFTVASESPPKPVVLVHVPGATCVILSFVVHPVLMDLPAGSSLEFFTDEQCTHRVFGYFGEKKGMNNLPPLVVPGDRCYVKLSQGLYARYKFRVDALTSDFGLSLWIGEELYQKLLATPFSAYEVETLLSSLLSCFVEYLVTATRLPPSAKIPVFQLVAKLLNFALGRGLLKAVPIAKLSMPLVKELSVVVDNERATQHGLFSLYTQQLAELLSLIEEVSFMKGGSSPIVSGVWWTEFVRVAAFTRVLAQGKREVASPDAFNRIYCGRTPIHEVELAHRTLASGASGYTERLILVQQLPKTTRVDELAVALSRFILHLSLEACGEADDQSVSSAAEVTRFGIFARVLYLPVDSDGATTGYAVVDVGREDIITNLLTRVPKAKLEFEGERTLEDAELASRIASLGASSTGGTGASDGGATGENTLQDEQVWSCSVCTLENSIAEAECAACGSPIPPELATIRRDLASQAESTCEEPADVDDNDALSGWACAACTVINSWAEQSCGTCGSERSADQVPPETAAASSGTAAAADGEPLGGTDADSVESSAGPNVFHELTATRFADALRVAEDDDSVAQVSEFLRHVFVRNDSSERQLADPLVSVLRVEALQSASSAESKSAIEAFVTMAEMKRVRRDQVDADEFVTRAVPSALDAALARPVDVYKWLRQSGYDLQLDLNHYASIDTALHAQAKWTFQMDCQLISMSKALSLSIGVLTLSELSPSHLSASHAHAHPLLASLETRDLRLRFAVLQSLNRLLLDVLPLVNLRPWSDPNSLRNRIVSIRQLVFPGVKIRFFAQTQDNTSMGSGGVNVAEHNTTKRPMVTLDRRKIFGRCTPDTPLSLFDAKRSLFASTMAQLSGITPALLRAKRPTGASDPFVAFIVLFAGENVVGEGGPYRQLFNDIATELLSPDNPLFIPTQNNATKSGEFRDRFIPKPSSTSNELLAMFEFVGLLMGCCLRTGVRLNIRLAPIVWKMLVKQSLAFTDLESVDFSLCESLKYMETEATDSGLSSADALFESFTSTLSDGTVVELKRDGRSIAVTKDNCKEYIRLVKATRLQECKPQVDAILRGVGKIVPVQLLQMCVWTELQQWICGSLDIDVELLKRHTRYSSGMSPDKFPHLDLFWRVLSSFSEENKRRFINFAWGQDTLPADDAEFDRTHTRLLIKAPPTSASPQDALLPKADTCFFNMELPAYSTEAVMREKLLLAITLCTSLDGDDQAGHLDMYYADDDGDEEE